jgi:hypothetical protein
MYVVCRTINIYRLHYPSSWIEIVLYVMYSSKPCLPLVRPPPVCFGPPNGALYPHDDIIPLTQMVPASTPSATFMIVLIFVDHTAAAKPYKLSLALAITSSVLENEAKHLRADTYEKLLQHIQHSLHPHPTGPKISSRMIVASSGTSAKIVGWIAPVPTATGEPPITSRASDLPIAMYLFARFPSRMLVLDKPQLNRCEFHAS